MATGKKKLQTFSGTLFAVPDEATGQNDEKTLYDDKVQAICARYIYYMQQPTEKRITYNDILITMEKEFWISSKRIADIIVNNSEKIKEMRNENRKKDWFKIKWAHIIW